MNSPNSYIDLSHTVEDGLITYKGLPAPIICDFMSHEQSRKHYAEGTEFQIGKIEMVGNSGTYIDAPFHRYSDGYDIADLKLEQLTNLEGIIINVPHQHTKEINASYFQNHQLKGKAVLVYTGWSEFWNTDTYFENHPHLTADAAHYLLNQQVKLVGIDSLNIDNIKTGERPVHSTLLGNNILIVEHLCNLADIPKNQPFLFQAIPPKIKGASSFPVRAFVQLT